MKNSLRAGVVACTLVAGLSTPVANADIIDDALSALPDGPITCEQASKYWTNTADYNQKVTMARIAARFEPRGPQILEALERVDEAANRCGLKDGSGPPKDDEDDQGGEDGQDDQNGNDGQDGQDSQDGQNGNDGQDGEDGQDDQDAPVEQGSSLSSSGDSPVKVYIPGLDQWITLPDLFSMVRDFFGRFGSSS